MGIKQTLFTAFFVFTILFVTPASRADDGLTDEYYKATADMSQWKNDRSGFQLSQSQQSELQDLYKQNKDAFFTQYREAHDAHDEWKKQTERKEKWDRAEKGYADCGEKSCLDGN